MEVLMNNELHINPASTFLSKHFLNKGGFTVF